MPDTQTPIALLYQTMELGSHLRQALAELNVPVVYETLISDVERSHLEASGARVVVVNLDATSDDHIDAIDDILEDDRYNIVFNDAQVTSGLSGWEQARWARHLIAKISGIQNIDPPRPEGAEPIPTPTIESFTDAAEEVSASSESLTDIHASAVSVEEVVSITPIEIDFADLEGFITPAVVSDAPVTTSHEEAQEFDANILDSFVMNVPEENANGFEFSSLEMEMPLASPQDSAAENVVPTSPPSWDLVDLEIAPTLERAPVATDAPSTDEEAEVTPFTLKSGVTLELVPVEDPELEQRLDVMASESWLDPQADQNNGLRRVWVLGASIGGPEATREFLALLPADYPAVFLLAQHMGADFIDLMTQQLAKTTALRVRAPLSGEQLVHGDVVVAPTTQRLIIDAKGIVALEPLSEEFPYSPSIDQALRDVADVFGAKAGAIIFSGMASDAIEGSQYLAQKGGIVYAQDPQTCVISSMVDGANAAGVVSFMGSPKQLAEKLLAEIA